MQIKVHTEKFQKDLNNKLPHLGYRLHSKFKWEAKLLGFYSYAHIRNLSYEIKMSKFQQIWVSLSKFELVQASSSKYEQVQASSSKYEQVQEKAYKICGIS